MTAILATALKRTNAALWRKIRALFADNRATSVAEFAMLSPVFIGVTFLLLYVGLYQYYAAGLSYTTQKAAREILVGNVANGSTVNLSTFLENDLCPNLPSAMSCGSVVVNSIVLSAQSTAQGASTWWTLMNANQTGLAPPPMNNAQTSFCIGGPGSTVALEVYYPMPFWAFPFMNTPTTTFNGQPVIWIASTAAFKNEPFSTAYAGC